MSFSISKEQMEKFNQAPEKYDFAYKGKRIFVREKGWIRWMTRLVDYFRGYHYDFPKIAASIYNKPKNLSQDIEKQFYKNFAKRVLRYYDRITTSSVASKKVKAGAKATSQKFLDTYDPQGKVKTLIDLEKLEEAEGEDLAALVRGGMHLSKERVLELYHSKDKDIVLALLQSDESKKLSSKELVSRGTILYRPYTSRRRGHVFILGMQ